jgi:hypothetical protein
MEVGDGGASAQDNPPDETSGGEDEGEEGDSPGTGPERHGRGEPGGGGQEEGPKVEDAADGEEAEGVEERLRAGVSGCRRSGCPRGLNEGVDGGGIRGSLEDVGIEDGGGVELASVGRGEERRAGGQAAVTGSAGQAGCARASRSATR